MNTDYQITGITSLDRVRYFPRQLITADDMRAEQQYFREKLRRHNRYLHGWGVVCGCEVVAAPDTQHPWLVKISAGYVITPGGDDILIPEGVTFDLAGDWRQPYDPCANTVPCPPVSKAASQNPLKTVYLAVCYAECDVRPLRMHPAGCGCDDAACEYSRIREGLELVRLDELPDSYKEANENDEKWIKWAASDPSLTPLPACSALQDDCVVLASITLPESRNTRIINGNIAYDNRRELLSYTALLARIQGITATTNPTSGWNTYQNSKYAFQFKFPPGSSIVNASDNAGRVNLPFTAGTNLLEKYIDIKIADGASQCKSSNGGVSSSENITINGIQFLKEVGSEEVAGSSYDWTSYSTVYNNACINVTFILRSANPGIYSTPPPLFDKSAESAVFQMIISTFDWIT